MLRKDCASNQGTEKSSGTGSYETSQHAPEPSGTPIGGGGTVESSPPSSSNTTHGENLSDDRDPHVCKVWPCPKCHQPRDTQREGNIRVVEQHSFRPIASARSTIFRSDRERQEMEQSESGDLHREVVTGEQGQNRKDHCS